MNPLAKSLALLVIFGAATTLLAATTGGGEAMVAAAVLFLALLKAQVILYSYIGLGPSRIWRRASLALVAGFLLAVYGVYLLPLAL